MFLFDGTVAGQVPAFTITDTKRYVLVVTLSTQDNAKLIDKLKSGFKRPIHWNKYQSKITPQVQKRYLELSIDPGCQGVNRLFVLSFEDIIFRGSYKRYFLPNVEIKDCNVVIDEINSIDQPIKNNLRRYENIRKNATGQGDG